MTDENRLPASSGQPDVTGFSDEEVRKAYEDLIEQWNIAERRIKQAEQVRAGNVVTSAIFELRYAGRKLLDAQSLLLTEPDWRSKPDVRRRIFAFLADATEDCVKAKHDAIDAMVSFVALWFERTERQLSFRELQTHFPNYATVTTMIADVQEKFEASRHDRANLRDVIYNQIENEQFRQILELYSTMRASEDRVMLSVRSEDFRKKRDFILIVFFGVLSLVLGLLALL